MNNEIHAFINTSNNRQLRKLNLTIKHIKRHTMIDFNSAEGKQAFIDRIPEHHIPLCLNIINMMLSDQWPEGESEGLALAIQMGEDFKKTLNHIH